MTPTTCLLDGFGPMPLVRPDCAAGIGDLIRGAGVNKTALYPVGGQTKVGLGNMPTKAGHAVDLGSLTQIIDFPARDMTITVQAGITIANLRETLSREKLRLPIDVPRADCATLGGILAANTSGSRRLGYGTLRDYVIGISALNDEGREFKAGGRVVKNVAGYDLCKLLVGSLGTLGIITQATLKLRPIAELQALVSIPCEPERLGLMMTGLHESRTRPVCVELLNQPAATIVYGHAGLAVPTSPWNVIVGYEGNDDAVTWQVQQLIKEIKTQRRIDARVDFTATPLWDGLTELAVGPTVFKATMVSSATEAFCRRVDRDPYRPALRAHAGSGVVQGYFPASLTMEDAASILREWRQVAQVVVTACPSEWKTTLEVWGPAPESAWLMRDVKAKFDPMGIFNPGRFVAGI